MDVPRIQMRLGGPEEMLDLVMKRTCLEHQQRIIVKGCPIGLESVESLLLLQHILPDHQFRLYSDITRLGLMDGLYVIQR